MSASVSILLHDILVEVYKETLHTHWMAATKNKQTKPKPHKISFVEDMENWNACAL